MTPPREPDRYDKQAEEIVDRLNAGLERYDQDAIARALRAAEASALERAARLVDDSDLYICGDEIRALASPAPSPEAPPDLTGHQCVSCAPPEPVAPAPSAAEKRIAELETWVRDNKWPLLLAAEKRIAELETLLRHAARYVAWCGVDDKRAGELFDRIDAALSRTASPGAPGKGEG